MKGFRQAMCRQGFKLTLLAVTGIGVLAVLGQDPFLQMTEVNTNTVRVTITNGLGSAYYSLQERLDIMSNLWSLVQTGSQGQVTFDVEKGAIRYRFFRVTDGSDWDSDGVVNAKDAQPLNAATSNLVITVESPSSGQVLQ